MNEKEKDNTIKAIVAEPNKKPEIKEIDNSLEGLQAIVGGYIEVLTLAKDLCVICDEEGKIKGKMPNCRVKTDIVVGTVIICGTKDENFISLNESQIEKLKGKTQRRKTNVKN